MSIWTDLWNLFFPHSCLLCGRQLISGESALLEMLVGASAYSISFTER